MTNEQAWVHRQAWLTIQFEWQDLAEERGEKRILESTAIVGKFSGTENYLVRCEGIATDRAASGEYWWPVIDYLVVYRRENGETISRQATDEEIEMFGEER